jgi:hypothetical protein
MPYGLYQWGMGAWKERYRCGTIAVEAGSTCFAVTVMDWLLAAAIKAPLARWFGFLNSPPEP